MPTDLSPKVSIILLNYNGAEDTIDCLKSLQKISYNNYNIVIVDNASPDDSMRKINHYIQSQPLIYNVYSSPDEAMQSQLSQAELMLLQTEYNGGYGYGNNIGIKYALKHGADYVLVLNNDTVVDPGFLKPMVQMCEDDESIGIVSGKIYFYDRPDVFWFNGGKFNPWTAKVKHIYFNEKDTGQRPPEETTFISGCMWLVPRRVFKTVGFINEEYFMYVEDLEYCHRVLKQGFTLKVCEKSHVWHRVGNASGVQFSAFSVHMMSKNLVIFIKLNFSIFRLCIAVTYIFISRSLRWIKKNNMKLLRSHIRGMVDGLMR
ncbi:MAG: glycosyltransferase family 2 protein [Syntrophobacterales bacterium]|nr:glycosyltransferase family 2 protein [Syntrophobacterales bacterium]